LKRQVVQRFVHLRGAAVGPDKSKAMKIGLYWILFLGQTIGDATILSHIIPLSRRLITLGSTKKRLRKYSFSERLERP
jgi:hypothetical protein